MKSVFKAFVFSVWLAAALSSPAQISGGPGGGIVGGIGGDESATQVPDDVGFLSTVGTTVQNNGEYWSYLLWQSTEDSVADDRSFALYRRDTPEGNFQRVSVTRDQGDERTLQALLPRAVKLGQNLDDLNTSLKHVFQDLVPDPALTVAARLSAVVRGTRDHVEKRSSLAFIARSHPLVAMALGQGMADRLPGAGEFTYELREFDVAAAEDIRVLGRVTVNTANPVSLPAPGRPFVMLLPDTREKEGHLAVHLRWSTPTALRELSLKHSGFRVYRVARAYAENGARKWQTTAPSADALLTASFTVPDQVRQVNDAPIYPDVILDDGAGAGGAENPADQTTYFYTDDNERFHEGAEPLPNGAQFYYFVTALDILGRDGVVSPGRLTTICDRMAPSAPVRVRVTPEVSYVGGQSLQQFAVRWAPVTDADSSISAYHVYRWSSIEEMQMMGNDLLSHRVAVMPHAANKEEYVFLDNTAGAPRFPPLEGQPDVSSMGFIYTVRALDSGACESNYSPHSAPSRGTLRNMEGPAAPLVDVMIQCHEPVVEYTSASLKPEAGLQDNAFHFELVCATPYQETFEWAEFRVDTSHVVISNAAGRVYFGDEGTNSQLAFLTLSRDNWPVGIYCRAATRSGRVTEWVPANVTAPAKAKDQRFQIIFTATLMTSVVEAGGECGSTHVNTVPGTDDVAPICVDVKAAPDSREMKIYRQVDDGPLTLVDVRELANAEDPVQWCDGELPVTGADVRYFVQTQDVNGLPSPLVAVGPVRSTSQKSLPVPMLLPVEHLANNRARLRWSCAPYGVERFELWIAKKQGAPVDAWANSLLSENLAVTRPTRNESSPTQDFGVYQTGLVGGLATQEDGAVYYVDIPVASLVNYYVFVRAVDRGSYAGGRMAGGFSNLQTFKWSESEVTPGVTVPWPPRELPATATAGAFHSRISAVYLSELANSSDWQGVGIRIGEYDYLGANSALIKGSATGPTGLPQYALQGHVDPKSLLYRSAAASTNREVEESLFPCVLYRMQVTSAVDLALISGDTSQVSPLMETIANVQDIAGADPVTYIHDPFINVQITGIVGGVHGEIFLLDRQPVISGATYAYLLVRFNEGGEIQEVLSTNTVQIP